MRKLTPKNKYCIHIHTFLLAHGRMKSRKDPRGTDATFSDANHVSYTRAKRKSDVEKDEHFFSPSTIPLLRKTLNHNWSTMGVLNREEDLQTYGYNDDGVETDSSEVQVNRFPGQGPACASLLSTFCSWKPVRKTHKDTIPSTAISLARDGREHPPDLLPLHPGEPNATSYCQVNLLYIP